MLLRRCSPAKGSTPRRAQAHAFIASAPVELAVVQPEDVFDATRAGESPGHGGRASNWRRKLPVP
jgi:4-alpha-glucanotransferase